MRRRTFITFAIASVGLGCGLVSGLDRLNVDGDASLVDGGADIVIPVCDGGCGLAVPAGFAIVTFATALPTTCPDTTTPLALISDPTVSTDACSCKCTMMTKGTCSANNVELLVGDGGLSSCTNAYASFSATAGCHTTATFTLGPSTRVDNNNAGVVTSQGVCGNSSAADASTLASTPAQVCVASSCETTNALCNPPSGQRVCLAAAGDVTCVDPFSEKHVVGASTSVTCSACGTSCSIGTQSCTGHLTLYEDTACTVGSQSASSCSTTGLSGMTVKSYDYTMTASGGCTTTETSTPSTPLTAQQTICCRPGT